MPITISILAFIIGISVGSFLNVVILRLGKESVRGRSRCPHCANALRWYELLPIVSYILQFGRCRSCQKPISLQYPIVEFLAGFCFLLVLERFVLRFPDIGFSPNVILGGNLWWVWGLIILWWYYICTLIVISVYDAKHYLIPDSVLFPAIVIAVAALIIQQSFAWLDVAFFPSSGIDFMGAASMLLGKAPSGIIGSGLAGAFFVTLILWALYYFSRGRAMGFGDVKLGILMGLILGWPGAIFALMLSFLIGSFASIVAIATGKKTMKSLIPFGPFLALGVVIVMLFGDAILNQYFNIVSKIFPY